MEQKINAIIILEVLGKPANYLKEVLENLTTNLSKEENVSVISKKIAEAKEIEKGIYSSFVEVEIETKGLVALLNIIFKYFPANIEIIDPQYINIKNYEINSFLNELITKLHKYDEIAKIALTERNIMIKQIKYLQEKLKEEKEKEKKITKKKSKSKRKESKRKNNK